MGAIAQHAEGGSLLWNLMFESLYDLVVIEAFKLIDDEKNLSLFSVIESLKEKGGCDGAELSEDQEKLRAMVAAPGFNLIQHRHTQKAHISKKLHPQLPRFADISKLEALLVYAETLIQKYLSWINGAGYSIDLTSIYAAGNEQLLDEIRRVASRRE
jgi:hypothetical protein